MQPRYMTLWILGGAALATLAAVACGAADEQQVASARPTLRHALEAVDEVPPRYVPVPGGILVHQDCVHEVPDGAEVAPDFTVKLRGVTIAKHSPCPHQAYRLVAGAARVGAFHAPAGASGWAGNSLSSTPRLAMFTRMESGTWVVPTAPPANDGQVIYLFPSLTNAHWIVQPVLQWQSGAWGMNNWAVMGDGTVNVFKGTLASVNVGDQLKGVINLSYNNSSSQIWQVGWTDITKGTTATDSFTVSDPTAFNEAEAGVLEAWFVQSCSDFPGSGFTAFGGPTLYQGNDYNGRYLITPSWFALTADNDLWNGPQCNFATNVFSDGTTQLYY